MMPEIFLEPWQQVEGSDGVARQKLLLAIAKESGVSVVGSMSML